MSDALKFVVPNLQPDLLYLNFGAWSDMHKDTGKEPFAKDVFQAAQEGVCSKGAKVGHISFSASICSRSCVLVCLCACVLLCLDLCPRASVVRVCLFAACPRTSSEISHVRPVHARASQTPIPRKES